MQSFREFVDSLTEASVVAYGDMSSPEHYRSSIQKIGLDKYWKKVGSVMGYDFFATNGSSDEMFLLVDTKNPQASTYLENPTYSIICEIKVSSIDLSKIKFKNAIEIDSIYINPLYRLGKLGTEIYRLLVKLGFTVVSGSVQFLGARRLWASMSKKMLVAVINIDTLEILEVDYKLEHGLNDFEYPKKYYSEYNFEYKKYRFVLKSIS